MSALVLILAVLILALAPGAALAHGAEGEGAGEVAELLLYALLAAITVAYAAGIFRIRRTEDPAGDAQFEGVDAVEGQDHDPFLVPLTTVPLTTHGTILSDVGNHAISRAAGAGQAGSP